MKKIFCILFLVATLGIFSACSQSIDSSESSDLRIITLGAAITEVVAALGYGPYVVGVDRWAADTYGIYENAIEIDMFALDIESLIALSPTKIIAASTMFAGGISPLVPLYNISSVYYVDSGDSIESIKEGILNIGNILNSSYDAQILVDNLNNTIIQVQDAVYNLERKLVFLEIDSPPHLFTVAEGTFLNEMINIAGGINIFGDESGWLSITEEAVIAANPQVILATNNWSDNLTEEISSRNGWENIDAALNSRIYELDVNSASRANHNIAFALKQMAEAIHQITIE